MADGTQIMQYFRLLVLPGFVVVATMVVTMVMVLFRVRSTLTPMVVVSILAEYSTHAVLVSLK